MRVYMFDVDETLTESRSTADSEMISLLYKLLDNNIVAIVSGSSVDQINKQLPIKHKNLILFPVCASEMYINDELIYRRNIENKERIFDAIRKATTGFYTSDDCIDNRVCQITFSALGKDAPIDLKKLWDPDKSKRMVIVERLKSMLPDFDITIGGLSSIDITNKGINKSYAVNKLVEMGYNKKNMLFVGDALFEGGNDNVMTKTGITCIQVNNVDDTKKIIIGLLNE
jgi:phosphomannomutase